MSVGVEFDPASLLSFIQTVDMVEYLKVSGLTFIFRAHFQSSPVPVFYPEGGHDKRGHLKRKIEKDVGSLHRQNRTT